jgi:hypothetical protein
LHDRPADFGGEWGNEEGDDDIGVGDIGAGDLGAGGMNSYDDDLDDEEFAAYVDMYGVD